MEADSAYGTLSKLSKTPLPLENQSRSHNFTLFMRHPSLTSASDDQVTAMNTGSADQTPASLSNEISPKWVSFAW